MTPAMWIAVLVFNVKNKVALFFHSFDDFIVGFKDKLSGKQRRVFKVNTVITNRVIHFNVVLLTYVKVVYTMCWGRMNTPSTRFSGYVLAKNKRHF